MITRITIGSRGSKLALIQAEEIAASLKTLAPQLEICITRIVTQGDRESHAPLDHMEKIGVFVKELESALLSREIDLAVHSLKDMPTEIPEGLCLAAVTERQDPADVLVSGHGKLSEMPAGSKIGTGSMRRAMQVYALRPDLEVRGIRGNVDTRLRKVAKGEVDGVILASAAMKRLGWEEKVTERLSVERFLPAVGQGAIAVETRLGDEETNNIVSLLNHLHTWYSVNAERAFLAALGGGCRAPIAALGSVEGDFLKLDGLVAGIRSKKILRAVEAGDALSAEGVGATLAQRLLAMGACELIDEANE